MEGQHSSVDCFPFIELPTSWVCPGPTIALTTEDYKSFWQVKPYSYLHFSCEFCLFFWQSPLKSIKPNHDLKIYHYIWVFSSVIWRIVIMISYFLLPLELWIESAVHNFLDIYFAEICLPLSLTYSECAYSKLCMTLLALIVYLIITCSVSRPSASTSCSNLENAAVSFFFSFRKGEGCIS